MKQEWPDFLPPPSICFDACYMIVYVSPETGLTVLSKHYDVSKVQVRQYVNLQDFETNKLSSRCVAYYLRRERKIMVKSGNDTTARNMLHEFFHHLATCKGWTYDPKKEEEIAEAFAKDVIVRANIVRSLF